MLQGPDRRETAKIMGAVALAASFTPSLLRRGRREQALVSAGAVVLGVGAGAITEVVVVRLAARLDSEAQARLAIAGVGGLATLAELPRSRSNLVAAGATAARVAGIGALLGGLAPVRERREPVDRIALAGGIGLVAAGAWAWKRTDPRRRRPRMRAYPPPGGRFLATVSGGQGSAIPRSDLDFEGTRFLGTAVPAADIAALLGDPSPLAVQDPVRVFVGVRCAPTVAERARLAVDELERLGGMERARVVVCSATLRGYVNPVPLDAEEVLSRGDVASVCVQYWDRPTLAMPFKVPVARDTHRALLEELRERVAAREPDRRPEIVVYGESLGAWASQEVFKEGGTQALDAAGVSRALWAGTPFFSGLGRAMAKGRVPSDERVGIVSTRELLDADPAQARALRFTFLDRRVDPVVLFSGLDLLWRRPDWLDERLEDEGIAPGLRWIPGITFLQVVFDLLRATRWTSDLPQAAAHDYRVELPLAVNVALGHHLDRAAARALADRLIEREVARGERLKALRRGLPDPGT
ncbi:alpha/beta-hydrolase family protein [Paraconexibacter sp.]|uniref:alpha/beta-hydrolase family protein n=1 Tax=Paraconexibacter sp. TaxID=2949640 RepID=UPI003567D0FD